jgi:hypothetical protein
MEPKIMRQCLARLVALISLLPGLLAYSQARAERPAAVSEPVSLDPSKVLGSDSCAKCHASELKVWQRTPHFETFQTLHRRAEAKQIAERLGLNSIKRSDVCWKCHYTAQLSGTKTHLTSGVSCESCHGAARDWIAAHSDYGPNMTRQRESAAHRAQRRQTSIELGMRNPTNLYLIARSCLNCHTVPDQRLVNVGGHTTGSQEFELVAWSQGAVRHNFVQSDGRTNHKSSRERLRVMWVVGLMADLEYSLRATALATEKSIFGVTSARRADAKRKLLREVHQVVSDPAIAQIVDIAFKVSLKPNNSKELNACADEISAAAFSFAETHDGTGLEPIDKFLPSPAQYKN